MLHALLATSHGFIGRALPLLMALQDPPRGGGGGGGAGSAASGAGRAAQSSGSGGGLGAFGSMLIPLLMIGFLYFFMIRPMNKQRKEQEGLQKGLQKGDRVVTTSGIVGIVVGLDDDNKLMTLEISEKVRVKFLREAVSKKLPDASAVARDKSKSEVAPSARAVDVKK